ncbi:MAG: tRNA-specific 2-thiouridylase MnmA [Candidatus Kaiserbacteria bacterium]|nr:tRNA-specific 2-thiouridylase MnmA [Candidatus Kaiserbacteria bacterium]
MEMQKAYVGLSGGVDSGVSAALLQKAGYAVTGVFIKIWQPEFIECTWREDRLDAMRVAAHLGIPFKEIDLSDEYKQQVIDTMVSSYTKGITPNPDVLCNEKIKFGEFYAWARKDGADIVATGHYARLKKDQDGFQLLRGIDGSKDQSYFVHRIHKSELEHIQFPIGELEKSAVRTLARKYALPVATKPDSQGLCFVGDVSMKDFLKRYITVEEGAVLNMVGETIGTHEGAALYTIGQRHGFKVETPGIVDAQYIVSTDTIHNTIIVSSHKDDASKSKISFTNPLWMIEPDSSRVYDVQTRYREIPVKAHIYQEGDMWVAVCETAHIVAPGQSLVVYDGAVCLGGGIIL